MSRDTSIEYQVSATSAFALRTSVPEPWLVSEICKPIFWLAVRYVPTSPDAAVPDPLSMANSVTSEPGSELGNRKENRTTYCWKMVKPFGAVYRLSAPVDVQPALQAAAVPARRSAYDPVRGDDVV